MAWTDLKCKFAAGRCEVVAGDCVHGEHRGNDGGDEEDAHTRTLTLHICPGDYHHVDCDDGGDIDDDCWSHVTVVMVVMLMMTVLMLVIKIKID